MDSEVVNVLREWGFSEEIVGKFREQEIDGDAFLALTPEIIDELFVKAGPRAKFKKRHSALLKVQDNLTQISAATDTSLCVNGVVPFHNNLMHGSTIATSLCVPSNNLPQKEINVPQTSTNTSNIIDSGINFQNEEDGTFIVTLSPSPRDNLIDDMSSGLLSPISLTSGISGLNFNSSETDACVFDGVSDLWNETDDRRGSSAESVSESVKESTGSPESDSDKGNNQTLDEDSSQVLDKRGTGRPDSAKENHGSRTTDKLTGKRSQQVLSISELLKGDNWEGDTTRVEERPAGRKNQKKIVGDNYKRRT